MSRLPQRKQARCAMRRAELQLHQVEQTRTGRRFFFRLDAGTDTSEVIITIPGDPAETDCDTAYFAAQHRLTALLHEEVLSHRHADAAAMASEPSMMLH